jgi:hypothetical protein
VLSRVKIVVVLRPIAQLVVVRPKRGLWHGREWTPFVYETKILEHVGMLVLPCTIVEVMLFVHSWRNLCDILLAF